MLESQLDSPFDIILTGDLVYDTSHHSTTAMEFVFSKNTPRNNVITTRDGQVLYKVETPFKLTGEVTVISRVMSNACISAQEGDEDAEIDMRDRFSVMAQIDWKTVGATKLQLAGLDIPIKKDGLLHQ
jgi:hypothetical protein